MIATKWGKENFNLQLDKPNNKEVLRVENCKISQHDEVYCNISHLKAISDNNI